MILKNLRQNIKRQLFLDVLPFICSRFVLSGIVSWGIGCGKADVPGVYASVRNALCFIDWDTKCKHGNEFNAHYDFSSDCQNWIDDTIATYEKDATIFKNQLRRLEQLKNSCENH